MAAFSADAHDAVEDPIDVLYVDGAHRYRPARADIRDWGAGVADGGTLLIHDAFSSVGVTLAIGRQLVAGRRFRYVGRSRSLVEYRADLSGRGRLANAARQLAQLPWFVRNLALKVLLTLGWGTPAAPPRPPRPRVAVLNPRWLAGLWLRIERDVADGMGPHGAVGRRGHRRSAPGPSRRWPAAVKDLPARGGIARGLGRSYGDSGQNGGGVAIRLLDHAHDATIDEAAMTATVPAGVSLDDLLRVIVPRGFFVPVSPGTRFVTVGGAIASDIHGKNHHVEGSFGNHVRRLSLLLADGTVVDLGPDRRPDLFWATIGGMGLTGVILDATISLLPIETSRCAVDTERAPDLDALLTLMDEGDRYYRYSVAWIDLMAKGANLGRSVLTRGDHATADQLRPRDAVDPLAYEPRQRLAVPPLVPPKGLVNHLTDGRLQRGVVPQGARPPGRPDRVDPRLLPPARLRRLVEPPLRPPRVPAVPVRRAVRRGGALRRGRRAARRLGDGQLPRRAEALRRGQPGAAQLPAPRLDAGARHPGGGGGTGARCCTASTTSCSTPAAATTWPRTPTPRRAAIRRGYPRLAEWRAGPRPSRSGACLGQRPEPPSAA